ncbi:MAG: CvpA family protein, partial [Rickettsiales bacterium]|nr:CvpA family protein [Rickettsiales bacterium]
MVFQSSLDFWIVLVLLFLSMVGLARGFLKETVSILNWFGSFYFTSLAKPAVVGLLRSRITTPFLLDIVSNAALFVFFVIGLSLLNSYIVSKIGQFIPSSLNRILGLAFGLLKGTLVSMTILASINILYRSPDVNDPNWLQDSVAYRYFNTPGGSTFVGILERIFGDLIREENSAERATDETPEKNPKRKLEGKIDDLTRDVMEGMEKQEKMDSNRIENMLREIA